MEIPAVGSRKTLKKNNNNNKEEIDRSYDLVTKER